MSKEKLETMIRRLDSLRCTYIQKRKSYETTRFVFKCETQQAWSYDWWLMFAIGKSGKLWMNNCTYSRETSRHFSHLDDVLRVEFMFKKQKLNHVYCRSGLQNIRGEIQNQLLKKFILEVKFQTANKLNKARIEKNIESIEKQITKLKECGQDLGRESMRFDSKTISDLKERAQASVQQDKAWTAQKREAEKQRKIESEARKNQAIQQFLQGESNEQQSA
jgi:hypothetical protein